MFTFRFNGWKSFDIVSFIYVCDEARLLFFFIYIFRILCRLSKIDGDTSRWLVWSKIKRKPFRLSEEGSSTSEAFQGTKSAIFEKCHPSSTDLRFIIFNLINTFVGFVWKTDVLTARQDMCLKGTFVRTNRKRICNAKRMKF